MKYNKWLEKNTIRLDSKLIAITGSTGGLGKEICKYLGYLGANLILINRNNQKTEEQKIYLEEKYNIKVICVTCDMANINSVYAAIKVLNNYKIDYLILNAGAYKIKRYVTDLGIDNLFLINNISPYLLVKGLIDNIKQIVMVSSIAYCFAKFDVDNYDYKRRSDMKTYGNSKRWLMFSLIHLCDSHDIKLSIGHPGITPTNIIANYPKLIKAIIKYPMKLLFISPKKASLCIISSLFNPCLDCWYGPRFFNIWGMPSRKKHKYNNLEASKMLIINESIIEKTKD